MFNTTKQMKLEGTGPQVNVRFNPNRLREVREEVKKDRWKHFLWFDKAEEAERLKRVDACHKIVNLMTYAYQEGALTNDTTDKVFTMIHQMLVERNIFDSHWSMEMPVITLLD
jgi:hypothetical protein